MGRTTSAVMAIGIRSLVRYTARRRGVKARPLASVVLIAATATLLLAQSALAQIEDPPSEDRVVFVNRIDIVGNDNVSLAELRNRMRTQEPSFFSILRKPKFELAVLERDVAQLQAYYHAIGYPDATVKIERVEYLENDRFADITIRVVEGQPIRVSSVAFSGNLVIADKELRNGLLLAPGKPFNSSLLRTDVYTLRNKYFNLGYLGVAIVDSVYERGREVDIRFDIDPGERLNVGKISIDGNQDVHTSVIEAELEVRPGDVCRFEKVVKTQRNLFETGLFNVVDVLPDSIDVAARTVDIRIRVRERKSSWIETGFGVGNVLGSRIFAEWGTRNLWGTGRTLRFKAQYAFDLFEGSDIDVDKFRVDNVYYRYDAIYQQRRVFGIKLNGSINAYIEDDRTVPDLEVKTVGTSFGVTHNFGKPRPDFGYDSQLSATFSIEDIRRREKDLPEDRSRSNVLGASLSRDTRDFVLNPLRGQYRVVAPSIAGGILGGDNDFYLLSATQQMYHPAGGSVFAWRFRVGYGNAYGRSDAVPREDRYYLGGGNSVRGYGESALGPRGGEDGKTVEGGEFMMLANVEIRYPLPYFGKWNFAGTFFLDGGNVWGTISDVSAEDFKLTSDRDQTESDDFRYGIGMGLRYNTPIGPIRVDWGYPLKPDSFTDPKGTFYFSLGQIF